MYYHSWDVGTGIVVHAFDKHGLARVVCADA